MWNLMYVTLLLIVSVACVLSATTGLPPTVIRTLNETDVGPEFVPVEALPSSISASAARASTDYSGEQDIEGKKFFFYFVLQRFKKTNEI